LCPITRPRIDGAPDLERSLATMCTVGKTIEDVIMAIFCGVLSGEDCPAGTRWTVVAELTLCGWGCWFVDRENLIGMDVFELLDNAAWPMDLDQFGAGIAS
jgi:hypothetical protein